MDPSSIILKLLAVLVLVGINAYFVAAEFALVAVRRTRIEQRVRTGDRRARYVLNSLEHPDDFISAAQLGITIASIAIGYIAEGTIAALIEPSIGKIDFPLAWRVLGTASVTAHVVATIITLMTVTYLHVVLGEQVPKMVAIQRAEVVALWTVRPTQWFGAAFRPFIRFMSGSAGSITRLFGVPPTGMHSMPHTPEEIRLLIEQSQEHGDIEAEQEQMIAGVFEFPEIMAREVMTPRRDIKALEVGSTMDEVMQFLIEEGHSRVPIFEEDLDKIVGVLLAKDLLPYLVGSKGEGFQLREVMREPYFVPDTKLLGELMTEMRAQNVHMVIVIDEFGGTEGIVTMEDLLEEIVGDIYDEYDEPEPDIEVTDDGEIMVDGGASIDEVNERFDMSISSDDYDTIGGFIFGTLGRVPAKGDRVTVQRSGELIVTETQDRRVTRVKILPFRRKRYRNGVEEDDAEETAEEETEEERE
ncbi:MAG: hemolysin family protein [Gemmatimonadota bacterium]